MQSVAQCSWLDFLWSRRWAGTHFLFQLIRFVLCLFSVRKRKLNALITRSHFVSHCAAVAVGHGGIIFWYGSLPRPTISSMSRNQQTRTLCSDIQEHHFTQNPDHPPHLKQLLSLSLLLSSGLGRRFSLDLSWVSTVPQSNLHALCPPFYGPCWCALI